MPRGLSITNMTNITSVSLCLCWLRLRHVRSFGEPVAGATSSIRWSLSRFTALVEPPSPAEEAKGKEHQQHASEDDADRGAQQREKQEHQSQQDVRDTRQHHRPD